MRTQFGRISLPVILSVVFGCSLANYKAYAGDKDSIQPVQSLTVFDGNRRRVGSVLGLSGVIATVSFRVNGELVIIGVNHGGFAGNSFTTQAGSLLFESADCLGPAFLPSGPPGPQLAPRYLLSATILYAYDPPTRTIIAISQRDGNNCQTVGPYQPPPVTPLRFLIDLATQFQPPFTMR